MNYDWRIIGHEKVLERLEKDIENQNIASAYLFVGAEEIGKYRIAKTFCKILQSGGDFSFDNEVSRQIDKNIHPNVITVDALWQKDKMEKLEIIAKKSNFDQSERKRKKMSTDIISIDDVHAFTAPLYDKSGYNYKICLIKNLHRMNNSSANAFLKILEEPPRNTIFIMTCTHEHLLLETIISRARVFQFNLVKRGVLEDYFNQNYPNLGTEDREEIITMTQGRPSRMVRFLNDRDFLLSERNFFHDIAGLLSGGDMIYRMKYAEKLSKEDDLEVFFDRFIHFLRSLLIEKINKKSLPLSKKLSYNQIRTLIENTREAHKKVLQSVNKRLVIENLFLSFPE